VRIVLLCNEYPPEPHGGIGTFTHIYAHGLAARGHRVSVVGMGRRAEESRDGDVRVVSLPTLTVRRISWLVNRLQVYRWLRRAIGSDGVDIIEAPDYWGMVPFPIRGSSVIVRLHISGCAIMKQAGDRPSATLRWCERRTLAASGQWIGVSRWSLEHTRALFALRERRSEVIYYPLVAPEPNPAIDARLPREFILYAGTVNRRKGALCLARAARPVLAARPDLHLVYLGRLSADDSRAADRHILDILGGELAGRVHFLGHKDRGAVYHAMLRARVLAFPSTLETFGLVAAEAMLAGCPVIVTTVGPFPEFVTDGVTGLMVEPEDSVALQGALERVLDDPTGCAAMVQRARTSIAEQLSLDRCLERSLGFYDACRA
jgi:glycosyltransferase involved in cell wall biosynthesis